MPMEAKEIFEAESQSVRKLLSDPGVGFYIPPYQRPYSWAKDKVQRLLEDTLHGFGQLVENEESFTFLGSIITIHDRDCVTIQPIVRTDVPAKVLNVIDGQQRLTTLILICVALHNLISLMHAKLLKAYKGSAPPAPDAANWLDGQTLTSLAALQDTFMQLQPHGTARKYPRMIRAFDDQWSRNKDLAKYDSPISRLISSYTETIDPKPVPEFKPAVRSQRPLEGEDALVARYKQILGTLKAIYAGKAEEGLEELPTIKKIVDSRKFQKALLNHEFPAEVSAKLTSSEPSDDFQGLLRLVFLASYVLDRVALTVVKGKNEDYAFSVFESLNTTGEPLTAFETFRPRVVYAEGIKEYEGSEARKLLDQVVDYLAGFKAGDPLQTATRDLLVSFASAETGERLSKRLADQRRYLKDEYGRYEADSADRLAFVRHLRDTAVFLQHAWECKEQPPLLYGLPVAATTDTVKLCLAFLYSAGHTMTVGTLVRYYSATLWATPSEQPTRVQEFEAAIKAVTAFSVLWRASHRGTANIDQEYRDIMLGRDKAGLLAPLARKLPQEAGDGVTPPSVDVTKLKAEFRRRLTDAGHGVITNKSEWIRQAAALPSYSNSRHVTRFVLLAAYHDAVEDPAEPGLIVQGKAGASQCLTFDGWKDDKHLSLEHIAPKEKSMGWDPKLYEDRELINRIGNLVLVQQEANASLSNRPWTEKLILYSALGAASHHDARKVFEEAEQGGMTFAPSTLELAKLSMHMPHLAAIGNLRRVSGIEWSAEMIEKRSRRILDLAWERLRVWLD